MLMVVLSTTGGAAAQDTPPTGTADDPGESEPPIETEAGSETTATGQDSTESATEGDPPGEQSSGEAGKEQSVETPPPVRAVENPPEARPESPGSQAGPPISLPEAAQQSEPNPGSSEVPGAGGPGEAAGKNRPGPSPPGFSGCIEFANEAQAQCGGSVSDRLVVQPTVVPTEEGGQMKVKVAAERAAGFDGDYTMLARADSGGWVSADSLGTPLAVTNDYRPGSTQYPSIYVRVIERSSNRVVAFESTTLEPVTVAAAEESWYEGRELNNTDVENPKKGVDIVSTTSREVREPTYTGVSRFNDADGTRETFEDDALPPVRYDDAGAKVAGPLGNLTYFSNLRENNTQPAILTHGNKQMRLGMGLFSIPSGEFQKMRVDYGLQTEQADQNVRVNLVDSYGRVIDPSTVNAPDRQLSQTTGKSASYFAERRQFENAIDKDNIDTESIEFTLTQAEQEYISENNDIYVTYATNNRATLLLYRTPIITQSVRDQSSDNFVPETKYFEEQFNEQNNQEKAATFAGSSSYRLRGELNNQYGTYDKKPGETVSIEVSMSNNGDSRVERTIGLFSMSEKNKSLSGSAAERKVIDTRVVGIEPRTTKRFNVEYDYEPHEYGNHTVVVHDITDKNNPKPLNRAGTELTQTGVYVLQPATFKVRSVTTPESYLIENNFNTTVVVQNVGDLNGSATLENTFQNWDSTVTIPDTPGGNVRGGVDGGYTDITFSRDGFEYSPSYPERPAGGNPNARPEAPYGTKLTYSDNEVHDMAEDPVDNASTFEATASHAFTNPNPALTEATNDSQTGDGVRIYKLNIITVKLEGDRTNDDTWYASGWGYTNQSPPTQWNAGNDAAKYDIFENPQGGLPSVADSKYIYPAYEIGDVGNQLNANIRVRNNGQTEIGDARVRLNTNKTGLAGAKGIVGTSGKQDLPSKTTTSLDVPVVIRNDAGNGGQHTFEATPRDSEDYIQQVNVREFEGGPNAGSQQFRTNVTVELWADFVHKNTRTADNTINERCARQRSGDVNPTDPAGEQGDCAGQSGTFSFEQVHKNHGGVEGRLTVDAAIHKARDPSDQSEYGNLGSVSSLKPTGEDYWDTRTFELEDNERQTFTANTIPIDEPGVYNVKASPHRTNNEPELGKYEDNGYVQSDEWLSFKVLDITDPEPYAEISDTKAQCKAGACDGSAGEWAVYEGARVEFDNHSVDNVVANTIKWGGSISYNGGDTRCHGADHCYTESGFADDQRADTIVHRLTGSSDETVSLRARDHPAYGEGATLTQAGTPNEATEDFPLEVIEDNEDPTASLRDTKHINPDGSPNSRTVWKSYGSTNYHGIEVCITANSDDDQIGIEADDWRGTSLPGGDNEDTRCRTWSNAGDKTAIYQAWDFAGNDKTVTETIDVSTDNVDPTAIGKKSSSSSGTSTDGASAKACVTYSDNGPFNRGGVGIYKTTGAGGDACVSASANADAPTPTPNAPPASCEETTKDTETTTDSDRDSSSATVTVYDYHGNTATAFIEATAKDKDEKTKTDTNKGGPCPTEESDDGGGGGGGGGGGDSGNGDDDSLDNGNGGLENANGAATTNDGGDDSFQADNNGAAFGL
jgi:hypothetical protein